VTTRYVYSDVDGSTIELTDRSPVLELMTDGNAEETSVGSWRLTVHDPDGDLVLLGWRRLYVYDDEAPVGKQVIGYWFVGDREVERDSPWIGAARMWLVDLVDVNTIASLRIMEGTDAKRLAETDIERINWLLTTTELGMVQDQIYVATTSGVDMEAADLRGQNVGQIITDCMQQSGRNAFIWYNEIAIAGTSIVSSSVADPTVITTASAHGLNTGASVTITGHAGSTPAIDGAHVVTVIDDTTFSIPVEVTVGGTGGTVTIGRFSLFYDFDYSESYTSTLRLSNYDSDIDDFDDPDALTFVVEFARMKRSASRVYSGIHGDYDGGSRYRQRAATGDTFGINRDTTHRMDNVKSAAVADARLDRLLEEISTEEDVIEVAFVVPATKVNELKEGMRHEALFSHLPGYLGPTWFRVLNRQVEDLGLSPHVYRISAELSPLPHLGDAFSILQWPIMGVSGNDITNERRYFMNSGDNPHAGSPMQPTTGLLHKISSGGSPGMWTGIEVDGTGTVDIYWRNTFLWTYSGQATARWGIRVNSVEVAATTITDPTSGLGNWVEVGDVEALGVAVVPGDVIEAYLTFSGSGAPPTSFFASPSGSGSGGNQLRVIGALAA
jgi:hypothetical protein